LYQGKEEGKKRSRKDPNLAVPKPTPDHPRSSVIKTKKIRSLKTRREIELKKARDRAVKFIKYAQVIRVPLTLEDLNRPFSEQDKSDLEAYCANDLGPGQDSQCISARFVDQNGDPILCYFGERIVRLGDEPPVM
jgi:hypothetical protein